MPPVAFPDPFERTSQPPAIVAIIPARYASTRLPGKPLAEIDGRPMIEHVYRRAAAAHGVDAVVVATDDERIAAAVQRFGGVARMTATAHRTGTDRIAEIARELACSIVVNVQGDLPVLEPDMIEQLIKPLREDAALRMSTLCRRITDAAEYVNPNVVKVVVDRHGDALYFSRAPIPYVRASEQRAAEAVHRENAAAGIGPAHVRTFKHIGLYGYRRDFLLELAALPQTPLEQAESLEQLRALEHGIRIRVSETRYESNEVDTPEDLERVRRLLPPYRASVRGRGPGVVAPTRA